MICRYVRAITQAAIDADAFSMLRHYFLLFFCLSAPRLRRYYACHAALAILRCYDDADGLFFAAVTPVDAMLAACAIFGYAAAVAAAMPTP